MKIFTSYDPYNLDSPKAVDTGWLPFFSVRPRKVEGKWVFLRTIERRQKYREPPEWVKTYPSHRHTDYRRRNKLRTLMGG